MRWVKAPEYSVYVLVLPEDATEHCPRRGAATSKKGVLYVGSTHKSVAERYAEHRRGVASHITRRYPPLRMRRGLGKKARTRAEAERLEAELARTLRRRGFAVCQG